MPGIDLVSATPKFRVTAVEIRSESGLRIRASQYITCYVGNVAVKEI